MTEPLATLRVGTATTADRDRPVVPARTALLSIDMQNAEYDATRLAAARADDVSERGNAEFLVRLADIVIPNQQQLQDAARAAGAEVIYTVIEALTVDGRDISLDHKISGLFHPKGSWDAGVIPEVAPQGDEIVIPKTASGMFNATNVEYVLRNLGVEYLVIYGVSTDQCVETTVRDACDRGFLVTLVDDACAALEAPRHARAIDAVGGHYCRVRTTAQMLAEFASAACAPSSSDLP